MQLSFTKSTFLLIDMDFINCLFHSTRCVTVVNANGHTWYWLLISLSRLSALVNIQVKNLCCDNFFISLNQFTTVLSQNTQHITCISFGVQYISELMYTGMLCFKSILNCREKGLGQIPVNLVLSHKPCEGRTFNDVLYVKALKLTSAVTLMTLYFSFSAASGQASILASRDYKSTCKHLSADKHTSSYLVGSTDI